MNALPVVALAGLVLAACSSEPVAPVSQRALRAAAALSGAANKGPQDLGFLGTGAQALGISPNGTVVGQFDAQTGDIRAFIWTSKAGMTQLTPPAGSSLDWAYSVNDAGQAVGFSNLTTGQFAILWTNGVPYNLGALGGTGSSAASGINAIGEVVGTSNSHAMLWVPNTKNGTTGTMYDIDGRPEGSYAAAVNEAGQVVGTMSETDASQHAFLWTPNVSNGTVGTMVDIDPTHGDSHAFGLNDRGDVVGQHDVGGGVPGAFIWNAATGMREIGTFPGGSNSAANGVDRTSRVVGSAFTASGNFHAFVWTSKNSIQDLGTLGGNFAEAWATNPKGQAVGVSQTASGQNHAALWNLP
jgi:probable HAF family extracellular repeat protein